MFAQVDAGILIGDKLSPAAKNKVIGATKNELVNGSGSSNSLFKCGPTIRPVPGADKIPLEDENEFGDFHKNVLGSYEKIVNVLNVKGQFLFAPVVFDPIALAIALDTPEKPNLKFPEEFILYGIALPLLAPKLGFKSPVDIAKLLAKVPSIVVPSLPTLNVPKLDIDPAKFDALLKFNAWPAKLPGLFSDLALQVPALFVDILSFKFDKICETVMGSGLFGEFDSRSVIQVAVAKQVSIAIAESIVIAMVASTIGSASNGIVGQLGRTFGYQPPA